MNDFRDVTNVAIKAGDTEFPSTELIPALGIIECQQQWVRVVPLVPFAGGFGFLPLVNEAGVIFLAGPEPFFVTGRQRLRIPAAASTSAGVYVTKASRRELLPALPFSSQVANGPLSTELAAISGLASAAIPAGQWSVLALDADGNATLNNQATGANAQGGFFGPFTSLGSRRGRYYEVDYAVSVSAGLVSMQVLTQFNGAAWVGMAISQQAAGINGAVRFGDTALNPINGPAHSVSISTQTQTLNRSNWTLAFAPDTAGAVVTLHRLNILRQGF